jgi:polyisoprenoid-binding protein YceI
MFSINTHPKFRTTLFAASAAALALAYAGRALADVDLAKSTVSAVSHQMNVPVDGKFKKFSGAVDFDPVKPAAGHAQLIIDTSSYDLGDEAYNQQVRGKEWFDASAFPTATFISTSIAAAAGGTYSVRGKLTIKGKTLDVVAPVTFKQDGANQVFDGVLPIKRLQFDIGTGEWKDTSVVADDVQIKFHIVNAGKK